MSISLQKVNIHLMLGCNVNVLVSGGCLLVLLMVYGYLGSTRLLLSSLMSVGHSVGHSACSQNPLTVPEVVGGTWVTVGLHLALLGFTADRVSNLVGITVLHY